MKWLALLLLSFADLLSGCKDDATPGAHCSGTLDAASYADALADGGPSAESVNGGCTSMPAELNGSTPAGGACTANTDCVASCCACSTGSQSALLAWCAFGKCASADEACCAFEGYPSQPICASSQ
jgi:hypothetical protein